jgi:hypothetical protein
MTDTSTGIEGVRVTQSAPDSPNGDTPRVGVLIAPAACPMGGDRTLQQDGVVVFIDPDIAPLLDGKVLDVASIGADQVRFTLAERRP